MNTKPSKTTREPLKQGSPDLNTAFHKAIAQFVPANARVLDLGCGDGGLLAHLQNNKNCTGYGIEFNDSNVLACAKRGVNVIQLDLESGLSMFADASFDVVLQIDSLQHLHNTQSVLQEATRVGKLAILALPNFAHWRNRISILMGHMPVTKRLPHQWHDTPNIRVGTHVDLKNLVIQSGLILQDSFGLHENQVVRFLPNLLASTAVVVVHPKEVLEY